MHMQQHGSFVEISPTHDDMKLIHTTTCRRLLRRIECDVMSRLNGHNSYINAGAASLHSTPTVLPSSDPEGHKRIHPSVSPVCSLARRIYLPEDSIYRLTLNNSVSAPISKEAARRVTSRNQKFSSSAKRACSSSLRGGESSSTDSG